MDYADVAEICHHDDWDAFLNTVGSARIVLLSTKSSESLWKFNFSSEDILLLGRESAGAPDFVHNRADSVVSLPMPGAGRCMNVTVTAGISLSEGLRQVGLFT